MHKHKNKNPLQKLETIMSQFKDDVEALIAKIAQGQGTDQATKDAVAALVARANANDATDAEIQQVIKDLATKLADSTPTA
jgi:endonuclease III